jgi:metal-responsive CopG/Arc/MetJ family transcriptional regulator
VKTTIELADALLDEVKSRARADGRTVRSILEEALRRYLDEAPDSAGPFRLMDVGYGTGWVRTDLTEANLHEIVASTHEERSRGLSR